MRRLNKNNFFCTEKSFIRGEWSRRHFSFCNDVIENSFKFQCSKLTADSGSEKKSFGNNFLCVNADDHVFLIYMERNTIS